MTENNRVTIVAGEASADAHAAALVRELRSLRGGLEVDGAGGSRLREEGVDLRFDFSSVGVVGITEIVPELKRFYDAYRALLRGVAERRPQGVILLDLPDFNIFLAGRIKKYYPETQIIYYISPQVWAWRPGRVKKIAARADAMLTLFPFEVEIYRRAGMDVEFVGHPLRDSARPSASPEELRRELRLDSGPVVALLPGSRRGEIARLLPTMVEAGRRLLADKPGAVFVLPRAPTLAEGLIRERLGAIAGRTRVLSGRACDALAVAEAALVASGTATLEAAIIGTPMVVLGAVSWPSYLLAKPFIPVTEFSLPNVIAGRRIVPELIQGEARPDRALAELSNLLDHRDKLETMKAELARVKEALGEPGASRRAAAAVNRRLWGEV